MQRPDSNLNPDAQPYARWNNSEHKETDTEIADLYDRIQRLSNGDGGQATTIAGIISAQARLQYELQFLYAATGITYPPVVAPPTPPAPAITEATFETITDWSRTWGSSSYYTGGGEYTNALYLYQAQNPENKIGMFRFNVGPAAGKVITNAQVFLQNINSPWSPTFVAQFGTHGQVTPPVGKPTRQNAFDVGWARGEGKWVAVPDWAYAGLSNGSIQGFTVGGGGASDPNSAYFMGHGMSNPPRLKLTYVT